MKTFNKIWHILGSINLTFILIIMLMVDLTTGYVVLKSHSHLFHPLNDMGFVKWVNTYGKNNLHETAWLFILIILMAVLSLNMFICTTQRVIVLMKEQTTPGKFRLILKLSPHIMHYGLLIMLLGYMVSYLAGETLLSNILLPGKTVRIPGTPLTIHMDNLDIRYYKGERLYYMQDRGIDVQADLTIRDTDTSVTSRIGFNKPVRFHSYSLHLKDYAPKSDSGMNRKKYIDVIIKKDPGVGFYFSGMIFFMIGLILYLVNRIPAVKN